MHYLSAPAAAPIKSSTAPPPLELPQSATLPAPSSSLSTPMPPPPASPAAASGNSHKSSAGLLGKGEDAHCSRPVQPLQPQSSALLQICGCSGCHQIAANTFHGTQPYMTLPVLLLWPRVAYVPTHKACTSVAFSCCQQHAACRSVEQGDTDGMCTVAHAARPTLGHGVLGDAVGDVITNRQTTASPDGSLIAMLQLRMRRAACDVHAAELASMHCRVLHRAPTSLLPARSLRMCTCPSGMP
jgi:hypothetical protein